MKTYDTTSEKTEAGVTVALAQIAAPTLDAAYDPHDHRDVPKATTDFETLVHLLKGCLGTGILAMPRAFYYSGMGVGVIATIVIGFICTYCIQILVKNQYELCKRKKVAILTYPETMEEALLEGPACLRPFAKTSNKLVDIFLAIYQLGICICYIVFVAVNNKKLLDAHYELSLTIHMFILLGPLFLIVCIRNLKLLAPFSVMANVLTLVGIAIIFYYMSYGQEDDVEMHMIGNVVEFPLYFGTTLFALEAVGVMIAVEGAMKTPKHFERVLNIAMTVIVILYTLVGAFGYLRYGQNSMDSVTLNIPKGEALAQAVNAMYSIAVFISYALQFYPAIIIVWNTYLMKKIQKRQLFWELACRIFLVIITFTLAILIPQLGLFIALFGAFCMSLLGLCCPALIEICVRYPTRDYGRLNLNLIKNIALILFGIFGGAVGTYVSLLEIIKSF